MRRQGHAKILHVFPKNNYEEPVDKIGPNEGTKKHAQLELAARK